GGSVDALEGLVEVLRAAVLGPRDGHERDVVLGEGRARACARALEADAQVGRELELHGRALGASSRRVVAVRRVAPLRHLRAVLEGGLALEADLHDPLRAAGGANE